MSDQISGPEDLLPPIPKILEEEFDVDPDSNLYLPLHMVRKMEKARELQMDHEEAVMFEVQKSVLQMSIDALRSAARKFTDRVRLAWTTGIILVVMGGLHYSGERIALERRADGLLADESWVEYHTNAVLLGAEHFVNGTYRQIVTFLQTESSMHDSYRVINKIMADVEKLDSQLNDLSIQLTTSEKPDPRLLRKRAAIEHRIRELRDSAEALIKRANGKNVDLPGPAKDIVRQQHMRLF